MGIPSVATVFWIILALLRATFGAVSRSVTVMVNVLPLRWPDLSFFGCLLAQFTVTPRLDSIIFATSFGSSAGHEDAEGLRGDGVLVLEPCVADVLPPQPEETRDGDLRVPRRPPALRHAEVDVVAVAEGLVGGHLDDGEELGPRPDGAADAWEFRSDVGERSGRARGVVPFSVDRE